jgi:hypothetical protein
MHRTYMVLANPICELAVGGLQVNAAPLLREGTAVRGAELRYIPSALFLSTTYHLRYFGYDCNCMMPLA